MPTYLIRLGPTLKEPARHFMVEAESAVRACQASAQAEGDGRADKMVVAADDQLREYWTIGPYVPNRSIPPAHITEVPHASA